MAWHVCFSIQPWLQVLFQLLVLNSHTCSGVWCNKQLFCQQTLLSSPRGASTVLLLSLTDAFWCSALISPLHTWNIRIIRMMIMMQTEAWLKMSLWDQVKRCLLALKLLCPTHFLVPNYLFGIPFSDEILTFISGVLCIRDWLQVRPKWPYKGDRTNKQRNEQTNNKKTQSVDLTVRVH